MPVIFSPFFPVFLQQLGNKDTKYIHGADRVQCALTLHRLMFGCWLYIYVFCRLDAIQFFCAVPAKQAAKNLLHTTIVNKRLRLKLSLSDQCITLIMPTTINSMAIVCLCQWIALLSSHSFSIHLQNTRLTHTHTHCKMKLQLFEYHGCKSDAF